MRLSILCEGLEAPRSLLEDGEGAGVAAVGDANVAQAVGPSGSPVVGVNTTADIAMYPKYLGFSYRGGTIRLKDRTKKRKNLHEEVLSQELGTLLEDYSNRLSKVPSVQMIDED